MSLVTLPANVRLPTNGDLLRGEYVKGRIDVEEFERRTEMLLREQEHDKAGIPLMGGLPPAHEGLALSKEWR